MKTALYDGEKKLFYVEIVSVLIRNKLLRGKQPSALEDEGEGLGLRKNFFYQIFSLARRDWSQRLT